MRLRISRDGLVKCVNNETIPLATLGRRTIKRASHVEFDGDSDGWLADLSPVGGPVLGPFEDRSEALGAETEWLDHNWL